MTKLTYEEYTKKFPLNYDLVPELERFHDVDGKKEIEELHYKSYEMYLELLDKKEE